MQATRHFKYGSQPKYPLRDLDIGESFEVQRTESVLNYLRVRASVLGKSTGRSFSVQTTPDTITVIRTV